MPAGKFPIAELKRQRALLDESIAKQEAPTHFSPVPERLGYRMYTETNFKTKKALKEAVAAWNNLTPIPFVLNDGESRLPRAVRLYAPGLGQPVVNGTAYVEGPHYPQPHRWYAEVTVKDGIVVAVK